MEVKQNSLPPFIGIFGGMGAEAGVLMHRIFIEETRRLRPVHCDQDDVDMLHLSFGAQVPDRATYIWDQSKPSPVEPSVKILESIAQVAQTWGRTALTVIPCNTYHSPVLFDDVCARFAQSPYAASLRLYHMLDATAEELMLAKPQLKKVGVLSTTTTRKMALFERAFAPFGTEILQVPLETLQPHVEDAIYNAHYGLKVAARATESVQRVLERAINTLKDQGAEGVILGCTELPLAFEHQETFADIFLADPMRLVARKMIKDILSFHKNNSESETECPTQKKAS